jgi:hypothetical protein
MALSGGPGVWIDVKRVVRARLHTSLTADAAVIIEINDAVASPIKCVRWTNFDARSAVTVVATENAKVPAGMRKFPFFDILHPSSEDPHRDLVFLFAGHSTGVATDTAFLIDDKAVTHKN